MQSTGCFTRIALVVLTLCLVSTVALAAPRSSSEPVSRVIGAGTTIDDDCMLTGDVVSIDGAVTGDLWTLGKEFRLKGQVAGDVFAAAQEATVSGKVGGSIRLVGQDIRIDSAVGRNVSVAGMDVKVLPGATITGGLMAAGRRVSVESKVGGSVRIGGNDVTLGGEIGKNVDVTATNLTILPGTRINGSLTYRTQQPISLDPSVKVAGEVKHIATAPGARGQNRQPQNPMIDWLSQLAALLIVTAAVVRFMPSLAGGVTRHIQHTATSAGMIGVASLIVLPLGAILLFATVIGRGLGWALLAVYFSSMWAGLLLAKVFAGILLGRYLFTQHLKRDDVSPLWQALTGAALMNLISLVPFLGGLVSFAAFVVTMGALLQMAHSAWFRSESTGADPEVPGQAV